MVFRSGTNSRALSKDMGLVGSYGSLAGINSATFSTSERGFPITLPAPLVAPLAYNLLKDII